MQQQQQQQQRHHFDVTRTRQDLINSGELFDSQRGSSNGDGFENASKESQRDEAEGRATTHALAQFHKSNSNHRLKATGPTSSDKFRPSMSRSSGQQRLSECCYSICNLALIVVSVLALVILIRFLQDEPLYEYGEYLLTLRFYRQLVFVIILMPLVLLLPLYNALSSILFSNSSRPTTTTTNESLKHNKQEEEEEEEEEEEGTGENRNVCLLKLKLSYQFLMIALAFVALIFVGPFIRTSSVESQLELEFRRHLKSRYESDFSYQLLDRIQEQYECCDHMWYRANLQDKVPISCFVPGTGYSLVYDETCPEVLGELVSTRCTIISACLFIILIALACLFTIDFVNLSAGLDRLGQLATGSSGRRGEYKISQTSDDNNGGGGRSFRLEEEEGEQKGERNEKLAPNLDKRRFLSFQEGDSISDRLRLDEREREVPLLSANQSDQSEVVASLDEQQNSAQDNGHPRESNAQRRARFLADQEEKDYNNCTYDDEREDEQEVDEVLGRQRQRQPQRGLVTTVQATREPIESPILLTRADYKTIARQRSQSPVFVSSPSNGELDDNSPASESYSTFTSKLIKSVLKRAGSPGSQTPTQSTASRQHFLNDNSPSATTTSEAPQNSTASSGQPQQQPSAKRNELGQDEDDESLVQDYTERLRKSDSLLRQKQLIRREQLRKSLQSVRFADD